MEEYKCPAKEEYNIFGVPDKPCCYKYHKYCEEIKDCDWKKLMSELERNRTLPCKD